MSPVTSVTCWYLNSFFNRRSSKTYKVTDRPKKEVEVLISLILKSDQLVIALNKSNLLSRRPGGENEESDKLGPCNLDIPELELQKESRTIVLRVSTIGKKIK